MDDPISRQRAINVIERMRAYIGHNMERAVGAAFIEILDDIGEDIGRLPSAEEESFEWCTDCKEYDQEKHCCHRWSKMINQTIKEIRGTTAVGEWVKVHGFCTPGGDPVWKCSNCGKGMHVYGVEHGSYGADIAEHQWVACPSCGAVMIGERYE